MELAGLEPATSWVRFMSLEFPIFAGLCEGAASPAGPGIVRNLRGFGGVPSRGQAHVMKFGPAVSSSPNGRSAGCGSGARSLALAPARIARAPDRSRERPQHELTSLRSARIHAVAPVPELAG